MAGLTTALALCTLVGALHHPARGVGAGDLRGLLSPRTPGACELGLAPPCIAPATQRLQPRVMRAVGAAGHARHGLGAESAAGRRVGAAADLLCAEGGAGRSTALPLASAWLPSGPAACTTRHVGRRGGERECEVGFMRALALGGTTVRLRGGASPASRRAAGNRPIAGSGTEIAKKKSRSKKLPSRAREKVRRYLLPHAWGGGATEKRQFGVAWGAWCGCVPALAVWACDSRGGGGGRGSADTCRHLCAWRCA